MACILFSDVTAEDLLSFKQIEIRMKKVTKLFTGAVAALALFFTTNVNAQNGHKFGVGINAGIPTGDEYNFSLGADARIQFDVTKQLSIPITVGYTNFFAKDYTVGNVTNEGQDYGFIPVKAGVKVFFNESGSGLYGLAELGAAFGVTTDAKTGFLYSPSIGYSWSNGIDLGVKYEGISGGREETSFYSKNPAQVALRLAYGFKL
jgi:hypothetical protein